MLESHADITNARGIISDMDEIKAKTDEQIIEKLKKFASRTSNYCSPQTNRIKNDLEFVGGKQYGKDDETVRGKDRTSLVFNLVRQYCNQIINGYRKKPYGIIISPRRQESAKKAQQAQALIRGWESIAGSAEELVLAVDRQTKCGIGYIVLSNDYASSEGWDQDIKISSIMRPDMVIYDAFSKRIDGADATECAFVEHISEGQAEELYGSEKHVDWDDMDCVLTGTHWVAPPESVAVCTYFVLNKKKTKIYQDADGNTLKASDVRKNSKLKSRETYSTTVCVYKVIGDKVVSNTELKLSRLPIIPFRGELIDIDGKQDWVGIVHSAKDPARLINWTASLIAEKIAISPKATRFVDYKSIAPYKDIWAKSNRLNVPYLPFNSRDVDGNTYTAPVSDNPNIDISSPASAQQNYQQMLSAILGMAESGGDTAGVSNETATSVLTRAKSSETANYQYMDNASKSVKAIGVVLLELMNIIYDTERMMPSVVDGEKTVSSVNVAELDIIPSELEVDVDAGPMLETQRKESLASLLALGTMLGPDVALAFASDIVRNCDFDEAESIATKLDIIAKSKLGLDAGDKTNEQDPEAVAALQSAQQTIQTLSANSSQDKLYIQQLEAERADKNLELQVAREKMAWGYKTSMDLEALKQQGASVLQSQKTINEAELEAQKASQEVDKIMNQQPVINVVQGGIPPHSAINGQRNDLFK